jgi:hypothetical protein
MEANDKAEAIENLKLIKTALAKSELSPERVSGIFIRCGFLFLADFLIYFLSFFGYAFGNTAFAVINVFAYIVSILCACAAVFFVLFYKGKSSGPRSRADRELTNTWAGLVILPCVILLLTIRMPFFKDVGTIIHSLSPIIISIIVVFVLLIAAVFITGILARLNLFKFLSLFTFVAGFIIAMAVTHIRYPQTYIDLYNVERILLFTWEPVVSVYLLAAGFCLGHAGKKSREE